MGKIIVDHTTPEYVKRTNQSVDNRYNGAYYYSVEIVKNFVPNIKTDRPWVTVNQKGMGQDHAIVFVHNNLHPEWYEHLSVWKDLILVCGVPETCNKVKHLGKPIYLPLSVDVAEVEKYKSEKCKGTAFVGRKEKRYGKFIPHNIVYLEGIAREKLLPMVAEFHQIYAVGRCAIEGKILDCKILPYDKRFPDPDIWRVIDSMEAVQMLQAMLDDIDKR